MLTQARLKELLHYEPSTGIFTHIAIRKKVIVGQAVGSVNSRGYIIIKLDIINYYAHRLAFLYMTGNYPDAEVDHKDLNKINNSWDNLRQATRSQNMHNRGVKRDSFTQIKGVKLTPDNTYIATIAFNNVKIHLGTFKTIEEARKAYINAANFYHGDFTKYD